MAKTSKAAILSACKEGSLEAHLIDKVNSAAGEKYVAAREKAKAATCKSLEAEAKRNQSAVEEIQNRYQAAKVLIAMKLAGLK